MPDPKQTSPSSVMPTAGDDCASRSRTTAPVFPAACTAGFSVPASVPFRQATTTDRAGLYPEYRPPDRSTAPPRQPAGTRQPFYTDIHSRPKTPPPEDSPIPRFYSCFIVAIMFAALFWTGNLYTPTGEPSSTKNSRTSTKPFLKTIRIF